MSSSCMDLTCIGWMKGTEGSRLRLALCSAFPRLGGPPRETGVDLRKVRLVRGSPEYRKLCIVYSRIKKSQHIRELVRSLGHHVMHVVLSF